MSRSHPLLTIMVGTLGGSAVGAVFSSGTSLGLVLVLGATGAIAGIWARRVILRHSPANHPVFTGAFYGALAGTVAQGIVCWAIGLAILGLMCLRLVFVEGLFLLGFFLAPLSLWVHGCVAGIVAGGLVGLIVDRDPGAPPYYEDLEDEDLEDSSLYGEF